MPYKRRNPLNDYLFIKVLVEKGDEVQLLGFLNAALGRSDENRLASVEILENKTFSPEFFGNKASILDLRARLRDGTMVNIEVQLQNQGNMDRRSLFYWSKEFTKSLKAGQDYQELPDTIAINIINFQFLDTENFHTIFRLREDTEHALVLTDALEIHFLDMVRYRKQRSKNMENGPLHRWLAWLDENSPPELIAEVVGNDEAIKAAEERLVYVTGDEDAIRAYEYRQKLQWDEISFRNNALREGRAEGLAEGKAEGLAEGKAEEKLEIARKMKNAGKPFGEIVEFTGLSPEVVENL